MGPNHLIIRPYSLRSIVLVALAGLLGIAVLLVIVISQFRQVQLRDARDNGTAYIQGFLSSYAVEGVTDGALSPASREALMRVIEQLPQEHGFESMQIWATPTVRIFTSQQSKPVALHDQSELVRAFTGQTVVELEMPHGDSGADQTPFIEIYAPLYHPTTRELIAVGEVYQNADSLLEERWQVENAMLLAFAIAAAGFLGLMVLIAGQQRVLLESLAQEAHLAAVNRQLLTEVEAAADLTQKSNEALLNQLGAELHDGPIQLLSTLALMGPQTQGIAVRPALDSAAIAHDVVTDLRRIAVGLILPELGDLGAAQTIRLAADRHRDATGTAVLTDVGTLPEQLEDQIRTCIYRLVQEGLNNAFRHGGGVSQSITARTKDDVLWITVKSTQNGAASAPPSRLAGLGLQGLRNRLRMHGGSLDHGVDDHGFFVLSASLPISRRMV